MNGSRQHERGFTLIELLMVIAVIALLIGILLPTLRGAREATRGATCMSNQRQIAVATRLYFDDHGGEFFRHHEGWVLDDGTQVPQLPATLGECEGGGTGNSQAEKPWIIFLQPYLGGNRAVGFCAADRTPRSERLATTLVEYNGGIESTAEEPPADSEQARAEARHLTMQSYLLNSVFTHKSARFAVERALRGFATDAIAANLVNQNLIMYSERNSEAMNAADNAAFGAVSQDDYDSWVGEAALVRWGEEAGAYAEEGWIRYNRHRGVANYVFQDGHVETLGWTRARTLQFPDLKVRRPLASPPR